VFAICKVEDAICKVEDVAKKANRFPDSFRECQKQQPNSRSINKGETQMTITQQKQSLKEKLKQWREKGWSGHVNLARSTVEELQSAIKEAEIWYKKTKNAIPVVSDEELIAKDDNLDQLIAEAASAKTFQALGNAIQNLSSKGRWKDWEMKYWSKGGKHRIYLKDISYVNPKDRGYLELTTTGYVHYCQLPNIFFPGLFPFEVEPDKVEEKHWQDRATKNLNAQFGRGGWNQADYDDEIEREEYQ